MKKHLLIIFCLILFSSKFVAQTQGSQTTPCVNLLKKYLVKINPNVSYSVSSIITLLKDVTGTNTVTFNSVTSYFEIITPITLDRTIISGHFQKNATPMIDFTYVGVVTNVVSGSKPVSSQ